MANTIRELRTTFTATAKGLKSTMADVRKEIKQIGPATKDAVDESQKHYKDLMDSSEKLQKALKEAGNPDGFDDLNKVMKKSQDELKKTGKVGSSTMKELDSAVAKSKGSMSALGSEGKDSINKIEKAVNGLETDIKKLGKDSGLDDLNDDMSELGDNVSNVGSDGNVGAMAALGGAIGGIKGKALLAVGGMASVAFGIAGLIKSGDELKGAMNDLQAQTGATDDEMVNMKDSLVDIYANNYGDSFQDIADSMANVKQTTGAADEELEKMTQTALMMRDTFGFEVNESIRTVDIMMKQFGITSDEAFTLLAQGQQNGLNKSDDMLDTFNEYSVYFEQMGFDAEDMFNILADGAENGVFNMDYLADAVKEFGIRVKDGSATTKSAFEGIGLDAGAMAQEFAKGGDSAQNAFEKTMAGLASIEDPIKRNQYGVELFGKLVPN